MSIRPVLLCPACAHGKPSNASSKLFHCAVISDLVDPPSHCLYYDGHHVPVDIIVITAVEIEINAVLKWLHPDGRSAWSPLVTVANGIWKICRYESSTEPGVAVRIALAKTRVMGLAATATLTAQAIQIFRPSYVVMLGI